MQDSDHTAALTRLADACERVRASSNVEDVLDSVAEETRALVAASHAWAAALDGAAVVTLRSTQSADASTDATHIPPLVALLSAATRARPVVRSNGFTGVALFGSGARAEGIVATLPVERSGAHAERASAKGGADGLADAILGQIAIVGGLALEGARLRRRVDHVTRARELLLGSVSHDLRNPLNTFAMSAGLLRDDLERNEVDATRGLALLGRMDRASTRMQAIIEDLVEASRVEARKVDYAIRAESAAQILRDAEKAAGKAAADKSASVAVESVDESARVMVDRARALQLLAKVVAFETKATGDGGSIRFSVARDGDSVMFTARAFGPGGSPVSAPEEGRGGLALLLARALVEAQRGTFRIVSGEGSLAVVFTLPAAPT